VDYWARLLITAAAVGFVLAFAGIAVHVLLWPGLALLACSQAGWVITALRRPASEEDEQPGGGWR
jgi:hypothetical protein